MGEENKVKKEKNDWVGLLIKILFGYVIFGIGIFFAGENDMLTYLTVIVPLIIFSLNFIIAKNEKEFSYLNESIIIPALICLFRSTLGDVDEYYKELALCIFLFICFEYLILNIILCKKRKKIKLNLKFNVNKVVIPILICIVAVGLAFWGVRSQMGIDILWYVVDDSSIESRTQEITLKVNSNSTIDWGDGTKEDILVIGRISKLQHTYAEHGKYKVVIRGNEIEYLNCSNSNIIELDTTTSPNLETIICENNDINNLKVSADNLFKKVFFLCNKLNYLHCANNNLTSLDISYNKALVQLDCRNNNLINLDISKNKHLETLECSRNNLTSLNVENNIVLEYLSCRNNNLISLDIKNNMLLDNDKLSYDANVSIIQ